MNTNPESSENRLPIGEFFSAMEEHITELRKRLIIAVLGLAAAVVICFCFSEPIMDFLCRPIGGLEKLTAIEITENVSSVFEVALLAGFILAFPLIAYEVFAFILPGLEANEKVVLFRFLPPVILFFLAGVCFAFFIVLPAAIPFLTSFMGIKTEIRPSDYISFSTNLIFWIGIVFEMPIVIYIAARLRVVNSRMLLKNWRQAVVVCAVLAMLITPTVDPVNMLLLMVPLIALYFLSILGAKLAERAAIRPEKGSSSFSQ
ncbi:MAG: twin-arginine translocase subunit TatC [Anaerolineaceae bacterium]|nr:twin-arginine translocase subunit TatC [Anaerolineaceae bacterium]